MENTIERTYQVIMRREHNGLRTFETICLFSTSKEVDLIIDEYRAAFRGSMLVSISFN